MNIEKLQETKITRNHWKRNHENVCVCARVIYTHKHTQTIHNTRHINNTRTHKAFIFFYFTKKYFISCCVVYFTVRECKNTGRRCTTCLP